MDPKGIKKNTMNIWFKNEIISNIFEAFES